MRNNTIILVKPTKYTTRAYYKRSVKHTERDAQSLNASDTRIDVVANLNFTLLEINKNEPVYCDVTQVRVTA